MPGMKAVGTNTESSTRVMAMIGPVTWVIAFSVASAGREVGLVLEDVLDRLDHDDGVVDHDADRQHQGQQRDGVGREAQRQHDGEGADQRHRHGDDGNERGAQVAEEDEDDDRRPARRPRSACA